MENALISRKRQVAGSIFTYLGGIALLGGGISKFAHVPKVVAGLTILGFGGDKLTLVASLEVLTALLFLFRPVRSFGLLIASAYLGGAICAHVQSDQYAEVIPAAMVLGICWLGAFLLHPQVLWNFNKGGASAQQFATVDRQHKPSGRIVNAS